MKSIMCYILDGTDVMISIEQPIVHHVKLSRLVFACLNKLLNLITLSG